MSNEDDSYDTEKYIDEGPWLTLLLLPLFVLLFRKGILLSLFLIVGLQSPQSSYALEWSDLWLNGDQKAAKQLTNGEHEQAFETAKSDEWKATAAFRKKDYQKATELFNNGSADGLYNKGNALAAGGKLEEALKAYNDSLAIKPDDEDTLYNKKKVEEALKKQEEQQKQDQENKDKENKDKNDQEKDDQDKKDGDKSEDQQQDQQEGDEQKEGENKDQGDNPEQQEKESEQGEMTEEEKEQEKKKQEEEQKKLEQADKEAQEQQEQKEVKLTPEEMAENAENKEAIEQWLRRIPDDPGGLLRRKFYYQYNQQNKKPDETEDW